MKNFFDQRIENLRSILSLDKNSVYYTSKTEDVIYLTGFKSSNSHLFIFLDVVYLLTDRRYTQQLRNLKSNIIYQLIENDVFELIQNLLTKKNIRKIIFEPAKMTYENFLKLKKIKGLNLQTQTKNLGFFFAQQDSFSIKETKKATQITIKIFREILNEIREDISEIDLQAELRYKINKSNVGEAFEPIVLFGKNTAYPHGQSSTKKN